MNYRIVCDSCCDFTATERLDPHFVSVPLTIQLGDKIIADDAHFVQSAFLNELADSKSAPKSACPPVTAYMEAFSCSADAIFCVTLSAELSGSFNSAFQARKICLEEKANMQIHIFNSRSAGPGELAVARKIRELAEKGCNYTEIVTQVERFIDTMETLFVLENLDVLRRNGRLSPLQAAITSTVKMKLLMGATPEGAICRHGQALTVKQALNRLAARIEAHGSREDLSQRICIIDHCACLERARYISDLLRKNCSFREIVITATGGISSMYASTGGIIVSY